MSARVFFFSLSAWSFPFGGPLPFSRLFLCWRPCRSRSLVPSLAPSWWWPCPLRQWALLTLSGCPERALRRFFVSVSLVDRVTLSPLLHRVFADGFRHWYAFRFCGGASPHAFGSVGALGELRWLHLYRFTPDLVSLRQFAVCHWSSGRCFMFSCVSFRTYSWRSFCQFPDACVSLTCYSHRVMFLGHLQDE